MKIDQNPFSIYDFLGYLVPGVLFAYSLFFLVCVDYCNIPIVMLPDVKIEWVFIILFCCYLLGHILSYLSSISIELFSIWSLGYPSRYLMNYGNRGFWSHLFTNNPKRNPIVHVLIVFLRLFMCIYILPATITDLLFRKLLKTKSILGKPMDIYSIALIEDKIHEFIAEKYNIEKLKELEVESQAPIDFFRFIYHYTCESTKNHFGKMQNYVALYGFTRTICFTSITLFWVLLIQIAFWGYQTNMCYFLIAIFVLSCVMYLDFNKFYRKFSLEVLMTFSVIYNRVYSA